MKANEMDDIKNKGPVAVQDDRSARPRLELRRETIAILRTGSDVRAGARDTSPPVGPTVNTTIR